jgi:N-acetyl-gamma-glutamyl-phosphate reductase
LGECDVIFFATPHGVAQNMMGALMNTKARIIDLSADFRIRDVPLWEKWYNQTHGAPDLVAQAVYGLPEVNRAAIRTAKLVACPGCYPTATQLGYLPLIENNLVDPTRLIANAASGASGAGRQAKIDNLLMEISDSFKAYGVAGHRHLPEIEQGLRDVQPAGVAPVALTFVPHLLPIIRGIHATLYATLLDANKVPDLQSLYEQRYAIEPFGCATCRGIATNEKCEGFECLPHLGFAPATARYCGRVVGYRQSHQRRFRPGYPEHEYHVWVR